MKQAANRIHESALQGWRDGVWEPAEHHVKQMEQQGRFQVGEGMEGQGAARISPHPKCRHRCQGEKRGYNNGCCVKRGHKGGASEPRLPAAAADSEAHTGPASDCRGRLPTDTGWAGYVGCRDGGTYFSAPSVCCHVGFKPSFARNTSFPRQARNWNFITRTFLF